MHVSVNIKRHPDGQILLTNQQVLTIVKAILELKTPTFNGEQGEHLKSKVTHLASRRGLSHSDGSIDSVPTLFAELDACLLELPGAAECLVAIKPIILQQLKPLTGLTQDAISEMWDYQFPKTVLRKRPR